MCAVLGGAWTAGAEPGGRADAGTRDYALIFRGSPRCGSPTPLVAAIQSSVANSSERPDAATRVVVELEDAGELSRGLIRVNGAAARSVGPAPCVEVLNAIAVIVALVLERLDRLHDEDTSAEISEVSASAGPTTSNEDRKSAKTQGTQSPVRVAGGVRYTIGRRETEGEDDTGHFRLKLRVLAGGEGRLGASTTPMPAAKVGVEAELEQVSGFSPSLRLEGSYGAAPIKAEWGSPWDFRLKLLRLLACPLHSSSSSLRWRACVQLEGGKFEALSGVRFHTDYYASLKLRAPRSWWRAGGANVGLELALSDWVGLEAMLSSVALFDRRTYVNISANGHVVHEQPPVIVGLSLATLVRFH